MEKVFRLLKRHGKTQTQLANFLGVKKAAVSNWKRGGNVSSTHAKGIVAFFKGEVTLDDIYGMSHRKKAS